MCSGSWGWRDPFTIEASPLGSRTVIRLTSADVRNLER
jgi:hypothetical protein